MTVPKRVGLIVPSSNVTMETELPAMIGRSAASGSVADAAGSGQTVTFHSSRAVLHRVDAESLRRMVAASDRCAQELADARVDVVAYACLVAVMAEGNGAHERHEQRLREVLAAAGSDAAVVSSAGALVRTLQSLGARRVGLLAPYVEPLTQKVIGYIQSYGIDVVDHVSLAVDDNVEVGRLDPTALVRHLGALGLAGADAVVVSACVQMPSLAVLDEAARITGLPAVSAASCTARELLTRLGMDPAVPGLGALISR